MERVKEGDNKIIEFLICLCVCHEVSAITLKGDREGEVVLSGSS
jgi:hypothetical protein